MKVTAVREFDIFRLLCHDVFREEAADLPFDCFEMQEVINGKLDELCKGRTEKDEWIQVASPEETGLDRFAIAYYLHRFKDEEPKIFSQKFSSPKEVKMALPSRVVDVLELINKEHLVL